MTPQAPGQTDHARPNFIDRGRILLAQQREVTFAGESLVAGIRLESDPITGFGASPAARSANRNRSVGMQVAAQFQQ
jgi:hypothetical protein